MIITKTPLRISFVGGGTDLKAFYEREEGAVLSSAISLYIYIAVHPYFEGKFVLKYSDTETVEGLDEIRHPLFRECLRSMDMTGSLEIASFADIPSRGSGLGSSSSFAVGLIKALAAFKGQDASPAEVAAKACQIEIEKLGEPIGKQDQYAAAFGGFNVIRFLSDGNVKVEPLSLSPDLKDALASHLVLFYTDKTRSASTVLSTQQSNTKNDASTVDALKRMRDQVWHLREELTQGRLDSMGTALDQAWQLKRTLAKGITDPYLDQLYFTAKEAGALGGKLLGAGGGGFFLFYCRPEKQRDLAKALHHLKRAPVSLDPLGSRVILSDDQVQSWSDVRSSMHH